MDGKQMVGRKLRNPRGGRMRLWVVCHKQGSEGREAVQGAPELLADSLVAGWSAHQLSLGHDDSGE